MTESKPNPRATKAAQPPRPPRELSSQDLFQGQRAILISHSGEQYRLTITRNDKLILQK